MTTVAIVVAGAVGARVAQQLRTSELVDAIVLEDLDQGEARRTAARLGPSVRAERDAHANADLVVLAQSPGDHGPRAAAAVERGTPVVSVSDGMADTRALLRLHDHAVLKRTSIVAGAGFAPGLTCVLAAFGGRYFDRVEEVRIAKVGTGGPSCARQHHLALGSRALDWHDGAWEYRSGGSGRELAWFPDPIGGADCYRAAMPDPLLLVPGFPGVSRVTARMEATRQDRFTSRLPMLTPPHPEGGVGGVRAEIRGLRAGVFESQVYGAIERPAVGAAAVAATAAEWTLAGKLRNHGAGGLVELVEPTEFLRDLRNRGLFVSVFEGAQI